MKKYSTLALLLIVSVFLVACFSQPDQPDEIEYISTQSTTTEINVEETEANHTTTEVVTSSSSMTSETTLETSSEHTSSETTTEPITVESTTTSLAESSITPTSPSQQGSTTTATTAISTPSTSITSRSTSTTTTSGTSSSLTTVSTTLPSTTPTTVEVTIPPTTVAPTLTPTPIPTPTPTPIPSVEFTIYVEQKLRDNPNLLNNEVARNTVVAYNGIFRSRSQVPIKEGTTALTLLETVARQEGIPFTVEQQFLGSYVSSINLLAEHMAGGISGWTFYVNGVQPIQGAGTYVLSPGDVVEWIYIVG